MTVLYNCMAVQLYRYSRMAVQLYRYSCRILQLGRTKAIGNLGRKRDFFRVFDTDYDICSTRQQTCRNSINHFATEPLTLCWIFWIPVRTDLQKKLLARSLGKHSCNFSSENANFLVFFFSSQITTAEISSSGADTLLIFFGSGTYISNFWSNF